MHCKEDAQQLVQCALSRWPSRCSFQDKGALELSTLEATSAPCGRADGKHGAYTNKGRHHDSHEGISLNGGKIVQQTSGASLPSQSDVRTIVELQNCRIVLAAKLFVDRCRSRKMTAPIECVDFKKAFDSVNRGALSQIGALYGVAPLIFNAIMALYRDTRSLVKLDLHAYSDEFLTATAVLQTLSFEMSSSARNLPSNGCTGLRRRHNAHNVCSS
jgi:hypothetical protein